MRRIALLFVLVAALLAVAPARAEPKWSGGSATIVIDSTGHDPIQPGPVRALGVYPDSRKIEDFWRAISAGAPTGRRSSARKSHPGALGELLTRAGVPIYVDGDLSSLVVYGETGHRSAGSVPARGFTVLTDRPAPADPPVRGFELHSPNGFTPTLVYELWVTGEGLFDGTVVRRPGIVTPFDLTATVLHLLGVAPPPEFVGTPLTVKRGHDEIHYLGALARRLERDDSYQQSLTAITVVIGCGFGFLAALGLAFLLKRRALAVRLTTGASFATAGFLAALFVPSARGDVRAIPEIAGFLIGVILPVKDRPRLAARIFAFVGIAAVALEIGSALHPGGEPALSFWGNPLVSWRFYGMLNYQTGFVVGGVVVGAVLLGASAWVLAAIGAGALFVVGAPFLGANFVGVLTLGFGAVVAVLALRRKEIRPTHFVVAGAVAIALFGIALAGAGSSHGGRAAQEIGSGGIGALARITLERLRLNIDAIRAFPGGIAVAPMMLALFVVMIGWSMRDSMNALKVRVAVTACSAASMAAMLLEDSGLKTSAVIGFPALLVWTLALLRSGSGESRV